MLNEYQLDLPGIAKFGIDKWMADFKPVFSKEKFQEVYENVFNAYAESMELFNQEQNVYIASAVNNKIINIFSICFFKYLYLKQLKEQGVDALTGNGDLCKAIKNNQENSMLAKACQASFKLGFPQYIKEKILFHRQNWQINKYRGSKSCVVLGYPDEPLLNSYIRAEDLKPVFQRANLFFPLSRQKISTSDSSDIDTFINCFWTKVGADEAFFNNELKEQLKKLFIETVCAFDSIKRQLTGRSLLPLIIGHMHNSAVRIIGAAWKAAGGEVTGVAHGNVIFTGAYGQTMINGTLLICNRFLASSFGQKIQLEKARKAGSGCLVSDAEIFSIENQGLKRVYAENRKLSPVEHIKKIMILGYPMDYMFSPYLQGHETLTYTHMTLQIIKILKQAGYYLIYKAHPDTVKETDGFFDEFVDEVVTQDFTEVYSQADCLFYISPYSTTFGFGAVTNKPMVYVNLPGWKWDEEILPELNKRAVALNVTFDDDDVIQVNPENLLKSILQSKSKVDLPAVEPYAFGA